MAGDWLRLYRKSLDSRVFSDDWLWRLWCWCLMKANWKESWKDGRQILPGQFTTGRVEAADQLNVPPSKFYRGIQTLSEYGQIQLETTNRWTTITICNWRIYQPKDDDSEQPVNSQWTASEHPVDTPLIREEGEEGKEGKKGRAQKAPFSPPTVGEVCDYCRERNNTVDPEVFVNFYQSKGWKVGKNAMRDWRAAVRTWEKNEGRFGNRNGKSSGQLDFSGIQDFINHGKEEHES